MKQEFSKHSLGTSLLASMTLQSSQYFKNKILSLGIFGLFFSAYLHAAASLMFGAIM